VAISAVQWHTPQSAEALCVMQMLLAEDEHREGTTPFNRLWGQNLTHKRP